MCVCGGRLRIEREIEREREIETSPYVLCLLLSSPPKLETYPKNPQKKSNEENKRHNNNNGDVKTSRYFPTQL